MFACGLGGVLVVITSQSVSSSGHSLYPLHQRSSFRQIFDVRHKRVFAGQDLHSQLQSSFTTRSLFCKILKCTVNENKLYGQCAPMVQYLFVTFSTVTNCRLADDISS